MKNSKDRDFTLNREIKRTTAQTAVIMSILTLISKLIGFAREMVLAGYFGASYIVDAYVMSYTILSVLFGGLVTAISTSYIPIYSRISENEGVERGNQFTSQIINLLFAITIVIAAVGAIFSHQIVSVLAMGFSGETAKLASFFVKVLFSYVIFSSGASILDAYLQYKGTFLPQIFSGYFISVCMIIGIVFSAYTSCYYLAFGVLLGHILRYVSISYIAKRNGYKRSKGVTTTKDAKEILNLAVPVFIGSYITYINLFIDKTLASNLVEGSISALNYASLINNMIIGVTITILTTIVYPKLARANSLKDYVRFNSIAATGINIVIIIVLPCSLGAVLYSNQIIQIVYERGVFDSSATAMTSSAFMYYSVGLLFTALNGYLIKIYYSMHNMKTPMIIGAISVIINVVLNLILVQTMAHSGLALATSTAALFNTIMLAWGISREYPEFELIESKKKILKITGASIISVIVSYLAYTLIVTQFSHIIFMRLAQLAIAIAVAGLVYFLMLKMFRIDETKFVIDLFIRRKGKK